MMTGTKQPDLPSRDLGSSQDNTMPKALGHEADNSVEVIESFTAGERESSYSFDGGETWHTKSELSQRLSKTKKPTQRKGER